MIETSVQRVPSQGEIEAYIAGFESVTVELRGYGLTDSERAELVGDAIEELNRHNPSLEDRYDHDVDELLA
jgi:hypothetical protein